MTAVARKDRATGAQADLLARLMESHVWTEREKEAVAREMFGAQPMTKERATKLIDRALTVIRERKAKEGEGQTCTLCDERPVTHRIVIEPDVSYGDYTRAERREVWACPVCADERGED